MAPKFKVSKEDILMAAFCILDEKGIDAVTTRSIAERLGVSSRPLYSFFPSMEALLAELTVTGTDTLRAYMDRSYTSDSFLNRGVGFAWFCGEKPNIAEFLERNRTISTFERFDRYMTEEFASSGASGPFRDLSPADRRSVHEKMTIFFLGLAMSVRLGRRSLSLNEIIALAEETRAALVGLQTGKGPPGS
jgi:AcrR family transcriptional regulator